MFTKYWQEQNLCLLGMQNQKTVFMTFLIFCEQLDFYHIIWNFKTISQGGKKDYFPELDC